MRFFVVLAILVMSFGRLAAQDCNCDIVFDAAERANPFLNGENTQVNPGDVICIKGGTYTYIRIINIHGTKENPIIIRNCEGKVKIDLTNQNNHGFVVNYSTHFRITGTGDPDHFYGFEIFNDPQNPGRTGMAVGRNISDVELDHVEAHHIELGLHLINVPQCEQETWAENWTMENASVHDWYVHDAIKEGLYIGSSKYGSGHNQNCNGETLTLQPPVIKNIKVFNNKFNNTGWDSFQVSMAIENCEIFNNECRNFGLENKPAQRGGIIIGGGSTGLVYNNLIHTGRGDGIDVFGVGNVRIFNNVIVNADGQGIFIGNREVLENGYNHYIINNTIINSGEDNIRYNNEFAVGSKIINNLLIGAGQKQINYVKQDNAGVENSTNLEFVSVDEVGFVDPAADNYQLQETSAAVDAGTDISNLNLVSTDFSGTARPVQGAYDVGAYEYKEPNNVAPVVDEEIVDHTVTAGEPFEFSFSASAFTDPDGDNLSFSATENNSATLPSWISFDGSSRTFSGTVPSSLGGSSISIKVMANDGNGASVSDVFDILIEEKLLSVREELEIDIYPNPTSDVLYLTFQQKESLEIKIVNMAGEVVLEKLLNQSQNSVNLSNLGAGTYIIIGELKNRELSRTFIKK